MRALPDSEALFVEHGAVRAPQLHPPVAGALTADSVAAVRAVTGAGIGLDAELHGPAHAIAFIPAVLNRGGGRGLELRVEKYRPGCNLAVRSLASPVPEGGAELRRRHGRHHGWSCGHGWLVADRIGLASIGPSRYRGLLRWRDRFNRRSRWPWGRSYARWSYVCRRPRRGLLAWTAPGPDHHENHDQDGDPAQRAKCERAQGSLSRERRHRLRLRGRRRLGRRRCTTGGRVQPGCHPRWRRRQLHRPA